MTMPHIIYIQTCDDGMVHLRNTWCIGYHVDEASELVIDDHELMKCEVALVPGVWIPVTLVAPDVAHADKIVSGYWWSLIPEDVVADSVQVDVDINRRLLGERGAA